jgi:hypothetical protein
LICPVKPSAFTLHTIQPPETPALDSTQTTTPRHTFCLISLFSLSLSPLPNISERNQLSHKHPNGLSCPSTLSTFGIFLYPVHHLLCCVVFSHQSTPLAKACGVVFTNITFQKLSVSSATADLTSSMADNHNGWGKMTTSLHRPQQSLSQLSAAQLNSTESGQSSATNASSDSGSMGSRPSSYRHSLDLKQHAMDPTFYPKEVAIDSSAGMVSPSSTVMSTPPKLQSSFSANDIPTVKSVGAGGSGIPPNANAHAQQHFHNHNASIGRIPPGALKRHSRELSTDSHVAVTQSATFPSIGSTLHANAPAFGPSPAQAPNQAAAIASSVSSPGAAGMPYQGYYANGAYNHNGSNGNGYNVNNMNMLAMGMNNMNMNGYAPQNYNGYAPMYQNGGQNGHMRDSQARVIQNRRNQDNEGMLFDALALITVLVLSVNAILHSHDSLQQPAFGVCWRHHLRAL